MRLLYYYPRESGSLIAQRLDRLDVSAAKASPTSQTADPDAWMHQQVANGVRADEFVKAVAWSHEPRVQRSVDGIIRRTSDPDVLVAAIQGTDDRALIAERIGMALDALPGDEPGPCGNGYHLLCSAGTRLGEEAKPLFVKYLANAGKQRRWTMCFVLRVTGHQWAVELLAPLLKDKRPTGYSYPVGGDDKERLPIRICDHAATTLAQDDPKFQFELKGDHAVLDRQIEAIQAQIK